MQLKKIRPKKEKKKKTEDSHGLLVPNTAKAKGTWLQADTSYCTGIWKYNKVRQQKAAGNRLGQGEIKLQSGAKLTYCLRELTREKLKLNINSW